MKWIPLWRRCVISWTAKKDAVGKYGEYLIGFPNGSDAYLLSVFMEQLAENYGTDCEKVIGNTRSLHKLYTKIIAEYEILRDSNEIADSRTEQIKEQLEELKTMLQTDEARLEDLKGYRIDANQTGVIAPESDALTLTGLNKSIEGLKEQIKSEKDEIAKLEDKLRKDEDWRKRAAGDANKRLYRYLNSYRNKISAKYAAIGRISEKYERRLHYYWRSLIRRIGGIPIKGKSLFEICQLRNIPVLTQEDLFRKEREIINSNIKELIGFDIDV